MNAAPTSHMKHPPTPGRPGWAISGLLLGLALVTPAGTRAEDIEREPINYTTAPADNAISRLQQRLDAGKASLGQDDARGFVQALLRELHVPENSQVLVFSKTSLQRQRIAPRTPRAIYFNDDVYIGWCQQSNLLEVTAVDPQLGAVFYTLEHRPGKKPTFTRQNDSCLLCHGSSANQGYPGHLVRSVYPDADGYPVLSLGTHRIDHRSPLRERWGGWYVTGTSGRQTHLGNRTYRNRGGRELADAGPGHNLKDLGALFPTKPYLNGQSDIVALMVLEHQCEMQNVLTRANFQTRLALHQEALLKKEAGLPASYRSDGTLSRIRSASEEVVKYMLFCGEARLTDPIEGTTDFAREFARKGPRDSRGRSLRSLDLHQRLFAYPCSYLIYSAQFDKLPDEAKAQVLRRLWEVLTGREKGSDFAHLGQADRRAILEILRETKPGLPDYWAASSQPQPTASADDFQRH